ncbi:FxSxx-COOH system tetratricopeptide repeat protein [Streptomyces cyaneochromogenes]|nr:FxSxx-COOH system tetratricopeptide repeat protein [Streptomyces cyaneochromogenes]
MGAERAVEVRDTGDASASSGGIANTGYLEIGTVTVQQRGPQEPAPWPHQIGVIPPPARSFRPRAEADRLRAAIDRGGGQAALCQVLTGMGGVGKTQLAADYARTAWNNTSDTGGLDVLVWANAGTRDALISAYAQAAVELCRADRHDLEEAAQRFLAWLTPKAAAPPCRWLIVLDDLTTPADLRGLRPPPSPTGHTLITTRCRDDALGTDDRHTIPVGLFDEAEAIAYLTTALTTPDARQSAGELAALASDLGHLPLALSQAATYINDTRRSVTAYRALLADRTRTLAKAVPELDALPDDQPEPLSAAWSLSIDRADALRPAGLARPVLQLSALLAPDGIPHTVLTNQPALDYLTRHRTPGTQAPEEPSPVQADEAELALTVLHRLSLIDYVPATPYQAVRVHQLVQRATSDALTPDQHWQTSQSAADALAAAWPDMERDTALAQALRTNTAALAACAGEALYHPDAHEVLYRNGRSIGESGQATAARAYFDHLAATTTRRFGPDHPDTLDARHHLARWRGEAGDPAGAAQGFAELVPDRIRILGRDHPDTLMTRLNQHRWHGEAGDPAAAAEGFAALLPDLLRILGPGHSHTRAARHNLAYWQGRMGDPAKAVTSFAELARDLTRALGHHDPQTLAIRHNHAYWLAEAGELDGAVAAFTELVPDRIRVLGPDSPHTFATRHNLAHWKGRAGDLQGAVTGFAELLQDRIRVLGPDHPLTRSTEADLAYWQNQANHPR